MGNYRQFFEWIAKLQVFYRNQLPMGG